MVNKYYKINLFVVILATALLILFTLALGQPVIAEDYSANLIIEKQESKGEQIINVSNIQGFLNKEVRTRSSSRSVKENEVLQSFAFSDDEIQSFSQENRQKYLSATSVMIGVATYDDKVEIDSGTNDSSNPLEIKTRLFRIPSLDTSNNKGFVINCTAYWKSTPSFSLKDILAITCSNNATFGSVAQRSGQLAYTQTFYYTKTGYTYTHYAYNINDGSGKMEEISKGGFYAALVDIPTGISGIGSSTKYNAIRTTLETTVYSASSFNVYSAYGHKYVAFNAEITSDKSASITFNTYCTNYAAPILAYIA